VKTAALLVSNWFPSSLVELLAGAGVDPPAPASFLKSQFIRPTMKPWISITSLSLNGLFLIATLVALLTRPDESVPAEAGPGTGPAVAPVPEVKPFHWDQIDAPDFAQFVNNLRGIGCPESIIQTIVKAELEQVYVEKRRELEQRLSSTSAATDAADEFKKLEAEQTAVFAGLMAESMGSPPESPKPS
jgi:hypothetical protein